MCDCKSSPVDIPFVKEEPFVGLWQVNMNIFIDATDSKHLVVVPHWLTSVEFFRFFEGALSSFNLSTLGIEDKAVTDPTIVSTEHQYLRVIKLEAAKGVSWGPVVVSIDKLNRLPFLFFQIEVSIEALYRFQWLLSHRVTTSNDI